MILESIAVARKNGARLAPACRAIGLSPRTVERWLTGPSDDRRCGPHRRPSNALSTSEEAQLVAVMTSERYAGVSPKQLVPMLADDGLYLASESTMYRLQRRLRLRDSNRKIARKVGARSTSVHRASGPNQVWSWDITWLPTLVRGRFIFLYLVMDVWSRRIVGWTVESRESGDIASALIKRVCAESKINPRGLILHSDNGTPMRGNSMLSTLQWLGIVPSFSRPHVSDDNPYSEALFRTLKYTPAYPRTPFLDCAAAAEWIDRFVDWYNDDHRHSAIRFVTPNQRHFGREHLVLEQRATLYARARKANPERWTRHTRNWNPITVVVLNPPLEFKAAA